jgi:toxin ParE1/3/4
MMNREFWRVRLASAANQDFQQIMQWTHEKFGVAQSKVYAETISSALKDLRNGPMILGARQREDIGSQIQTLHIARKGRKGRHVLLFRPDHKAKIIEVLRILHESMDLARHLQN